MMIQESEKSNLEDKYSTRSEGIDLMEALATIWRSRKFILIFTGIFLFLGLLVAFTSPVRYTAGCTVVPQISEKGSTLGGLASLAGISIGGGISSDVLPPAVYPEIIKSVPFTRTIMKTPITLSKTKGEEISLYEYYTDNRFAEFSLLGVIKKYTIGLPGVIASALKGADTEEALFSYPDSLSTVQTLGKQEHKVYKIIQDNISFEANSKDGYIRIRYTFPEAKGAAQVAESLRKTLEQFVIAYKLEKVEENLAFVEQSFEEARKDFIKKQVSLAAYQDTNRGLTTATGRSVENRLKSEYDIAFTVYNELAKQLEQSRLSVKENKPVLTVINPVVVPIQRSAPRRGLMLTAFFLLGMVISIGWVISKPFFLELSKRIKKYEDIIE